MVSNLCFDQIFGNTQIFKVSLNYHSFDHNQAFGHLSQKFMLKKRLLYYKDNTKEDRIKYISRKLIKDHGTFKRGIMHFKKTSYTNKQKK